MRKHITKIYIILGICSAYILGWHYDIFSWLDFAVIKRSCESLTTETHAHYTKALLLFFCVYAVSIIIAIPGNFILTLLGGFLFHPLHAIPLIVGAITLGSTLSVLWIRHLMGTFFQEKYKQELVRFNKHLAQYGATYILASRLCPFIPLVLINILVGLSQVPVKTLIWTTALGTIPVVSIYVFLGKKLMEISSFSGMLTPAFLGAGALLTILGTIPILLQYVTRRYPYRLPRQ